MKKISIILLLIAITFIGKSQTWTEISNILNSKPAPITSVNVSANNTNLAGTLNLMTIGYRAVSFSVSGTWSAGVQLQGSNDTSVGWVKIQVATSTNFATTWLDTVVANGYYSALTTGFKYVRLRTITYLSGTINSVVIGYLGNVNLPPPPSTLSVTATVTGGLDATDSLHLAETSTNTLNSATYLSEQLYPGVGTSLWDIVDDGATSTAAINTKIPSGLTVNSNRLAIYSPDSIRVFATNGFGSGGGGGGAVTIDTLLYAKKVISLGTGGNTIGAISNTSFAVTNAGTFAVQNTPSASDSNKYRFLIGVQNMYSVLAADSSKYRKYLSIDNFPSTFGATQSGTWNINNVSGTVSLPTGAATESTLMNAYSEMTDQSANYFNPTKLKLDSIYTRLGTGVTVNSHAVTNVGTFAVQAAQSGTWNVNNVSGTVSLPTGASTESTLSTLNGKVPSNLTVTSNRLDVNSKLSGQDSINLAGINTKLAGTITVTGAGGGTQYVDNAAGGTPTGTVGMGQYNSSAPTYSNGDVSALQSDVNGNLKVNIVAGSSSGTQYAEGATTAPATGTVALGRYQTSAPTLSNGALNAPMLDVNGNIKVNIAAGSSSGTQYVDNSAGGTPTGTVAMGQYNSSAPTYGNGDAASLQSDVNGNLKTAVISSALPTGAATESTLSTLNGKVPSGLTVNTNRLAVYSPDSIRVFATNGFGSGGGGGAVTIDTLLYAKKVVSLGTGGNTIGAISNTTFAVTNAGTFAVQSTNQANSGVDIGDVTINNASGGSAVNIQDGGNTITVDGTVAATQSGTWNINNVSGTVSLPTGAATEATLSTLNGKVPSNLTVTSTRLLVDGSGVTQPTSFTRFKSTTDTITTSFDPIDSANVVGILVNTTAISTVLDEQLYPGAGATLWDRVDAGATSTAAINTKIPSGLTVNSNRLAIYSPDSIRVFATNGFGSGGSGTTSLDAVDSTNLANTATNTSNTNSKLPSGLTVTSTRLLVDGSGVTQPVSNAGTFAVQAAQSGTWNINNISGTVSLPTGAATQTTLSDLYTEAGAQGIDIQNIDATLSTISATQTDGTQQSIIRGGAKGSTVAADLTSTANGANHQSLDVAIMDASGNQITSFGGGTQYVDNAAGSTPTGTVAMGQYNSSPPTYTSGDVSALQSDVNGNLKTTVTASALPTGAATSANQTTEINSLDLLDDAVNSNGGAAGTRALRIMGSDVGATARAIITNSAGNLETKMYSVDSTYNVATKLKTDSIYLRLGTGVNVVNAGTFAVQVDSALQRGTVKMDSSLQRKGVVIIGGSITATAGATAIYDSAWTAVTMDTTGLGAMANSATVGWRSDTIGLSWRKCTDMRVFFKLSAANTTPANDKAVYIYCVGWYSTDGGTTYYSSSQGTATLPTAVRGTTTIATPNNLRLLGVLSYTTQNMVLQDVFNLSNCFGQLPDKVSFIVIDYSGAALHTSGHIISCQPINKTQR